MLMKYLKVKEYLLGLIEKGKEGDLLPSENELCRFFGVSSITVRRAFNELERDALIHRKKGKGTFVKRKKQREKITGLMVILPPYESPDDPFLFPIISGILSRAREKGKEVHITPFTGKEREIMELVERNSSEGILWVAPFGIHYQIMEELRSKGKEIMAINRIIKNSHLNYVSTDHEKGAWDITEYFLNKGHKKIGFVGLERERKGISSLFFRYEGYRKALLKRGTYPQEEGVVKVEVASFTPLTYKGLRENLEKMLDEFSPTAILISAGTFLEETLRTLNEKKETYGEIEIATFDEVPSYIERENIHEIIQPLEDLGYRASEEMEKLIRGEKGKVRVILPPTMSIKEKVISSQKIWKKGGLNHDSY